MLAPNANYPYVFSARIELHQVFDTKVIQRLHFHYPNLKQVPHGLKIFFNERGDN